MWDVGPLTSGIASAAAPPPSPSLNVSDFYVQDGITSTNNYTTSRALNIGTATATRFVVISIWVDFTGGTDALLTMHVGSTALSRVVGSGAGATVGLEMWGATVGVGEGTSATVNITCTGANISIVAIGVGVFDNLTSTTPTDSKLAKFVAFDSPNPVPVPSTLFGDGHGFVMGYTNKHSIVLGWTDGATVSDGTGVSTTVTGAVGNIIVGHVATVGVGWTPAFSDTPFDISGIIAGTWH